MATMLVKDLIEILQQVDPNLPIFTYYNFGEYNPVDVDYAGYWINYEELMQSKNDPSYYTSTNDPIWKNKQDQFNKPFKVVAIK